MKRISVFPALVLFALESCVTAGRYQPPTFSYNGKEHNSRIIARRPEYGDGRPDGCIVMDEIHLAMRVVSPDSVFFEVKDVVTQQPVMAIITVVYQEPTKNETLQTNVVGRVNAKRSSGIKRVEATSLGYRRVAVDFKSIR